MHIFCCNRRISQLFADERCSEAALGFPDVGRTVPPAKRRIRAQFTTFTGDEHRT